MYPRSHRLIIFFDRAGFFPGAILIISKWYLPGESQTRIALFFTASAMAGAFSGLLAFGIVRMDGVAGYEGWRWVRHWLQNFQCKRLLLVVDLHPRRVSLGHGWYCLFLAAD